MIGLGLLVLRLVIATVLVGHGSHVLFGVPADPGLGPGGLGPAASYYAGLHLPSPFALAVATGALQLFGGCLIGIGYFTRWAAPAVALLEGLVIWKDASRWGLFLNWTNDPTRGHGMEYAILLAGALVCLWLTGAGDWSLDGRRSRTAATRAAGRARLRDRA
jgi:putative oxidoreductase